MNNVNVSVFSPIARQNLVEVNHINTFDKDITLTFTATESSTQFYITKGWSVAAVTPLESITLDYLYIQEHESQQMEINCEVLNSTITYLSNTGVNMADSNIARNSLNNSFKRNLSYAAYQQAITSCANTPGVNTLAEGGVEFEEVSGGYRYGFNGKEMDNEVQGDGNTYEYGFRIYNPRLGRFLSVDPLFESYPWLSTYQFAQNDPIRNIDIDGLEGGSAIEYVFTMIGRDLESWWNSWSLPSLPSLSPSKPAPHIKQDQTKPVVKKANQVQVKKQTTNTTNTTAKAKTNTAAKIKQTGNVKFTKEHSSGVKDNANAQANIDDAASGDKMSTSDYAHPKGAKVALNDNAAKAFLSLAEKYKITVSEIAGGKHGENSLYYQGKAYDVTHVNGTYMNKESHISKEFIDAAKAAGFTVNIEYEKKHIHLQWGSNKKPKN